MRGLRATATGALVAAALAATPATATSTYSIWSLYTSSTCSSSNSPTAIFVFETSNCASLETACSVTANSTHYHYSAECSDDYEAYLADKFSTGEYLLENDYDSETGCSNLAGITAYPLDGLCHPVTADGGSTALTTLNSDGSLSIVYYPDSACKSSAAHTWEQEVTAANAQSGDCQEASTLGSSTSSSHKTFTVMSTLRTFGSSSSFRGGSVSGSVSGSGSAGFANDDVGSDDSGQRSFGSLFDGLSRHDLILLLGGAGATVAFLVVMIACCWCCCKKRNSKNRKPKAPNAPFEQPILDPMEWFLTEKEITTSRGGYQRLNLATYTTGNHVVMYAAAAPYFASVCDAFQSVRNYDRVYMTGWSVDNVPFKPGQPNTHFKDLIKGAVNRGADVRMLMWANVTEKDQNHKMRDFVNSLPAPKFAGPARFVYDDRLAYVTSSHHQKSVIVRRGNTLSAYVGGVDLTNERWDTVDHDQAELRVKAGIKTDYNGWLDSECKIDGPAAKDVAWNFLQRWNGDPKPTQGLVDDLLDFENPEFGKLPPIDEPYPGEQHVKLDIPTNGTKAVQILRTLCPDCDKYKDFAPAGEQSIFHARIKAIRNAKNYIFIQDQYFLFVPELMDELMKIMPHIDRLIVMLQRSVEAGYTGYAKYMYNMVAPLQEKFPDKFKLYTTKESRELYIHSKIVIIDDVYVSHGSANWNRRGMTSDSELGCNIVDMELVTSADNVTVNKLAHSFRLEKFAEATKLSYRQLERMTFLEACDALEAAAHDNGYSIIEPYNVKDKFAFNLVPDFVREFADPDPAPDSPAHI